MKLDIEKLFDLIMDLEKTIMKLAFLTNGGAAIALFAFMGNLSPSLIALFAPVLLWFVGGVIAIAISSIVYYVGLCFLYVVSSKGGSINFIRGILGVATICGIISYVFFIGGIVSAYCSFKSFV